MIEVSTPPPVESSPGTQLPPLRCWERGWIHNGSATRPRAVPLRRIGGTMHRKHVASIAGLRSVGDSHASAYQRAIWRIAAEGRVGPYLLMLSGCRLADLTAKPPVDGCDTFRATALDRGAGRACLRRARTPSLRTRQSPSLPFAPIGCPCLRYCDLARGFRVANFWLPFPKHRNYTAVLSRLARRDIQSDPNKSRVKTLSAVSSIADVIRLAIIISL